MKGAVYDPALPHGVLSTYTNHGCRCESCRASNSDKRRKQRKALYAVGLTSFGRPPIRRNFYSPDARGGIRSGR